MGYFFGSSKIGKKWERKGIREEGLGESGELIKYQRIEKRGSKSTGVALGSVGDLRG